MNLFELFEKLQSGEAQQVIEKLGTAIDNLSKLGGKIIEGYNVLGHLWEALYPKLSDAILSLDVPGYSAERKQELIRHYEEWGRYGWTFNCEMTVKTLSSSMPLSLEDADQKMGQYCSLEGITKMAKELKAKGVNGPDLDEAQFSFEHRNYKASALLLFALIDHELISMGFRKKPRKDQKEGYYKTGKAAVSEYSDLNKEAYESSFLYANLYFINIVKTLMVLFAESEYFENEPDVINRHFIVHGMSKRAVTQIDCFKVWCALYSIAVMLPELEKIKYADN